MDTKQMKKIIDVFKVVSFDVFDTLIFRLTSHPEDIFSIIGSQLQIKDFTKLRTKGQQEISRKLLDSRTAPHADIDQIYEYLSEKYPQYDWEKAKELELQLELAAAIRNQEMYEVYQYALDKGKRVIAVSDMYLRGKQIERLLQKCGFKDFHKVYSSADLKKTKYEKTIFPAVAELEQAAGNEILHIGDSRRADVQNAEACGWSAIWYNRTDNQKSEINNASNMFSGLAGKIQQNPDFWYRLGGEIAGPLYLNLYRWVFQQKKKYGNAKIYMLARDGFNLYQICRNAGRTDVEYLETSRRALLLAGITRLDEEAMRLLPPYAIGQTLEEILDYLGVKEVCLNYGEAGFKSLQDLIRTDADKDKVKRLFKINEAAFLEYCAIERKEAEKYFGKKCLFEDDALIFDCGWNGSSQYLLKRFLDAVGYQGKIRFLYVGIMNTEKSRRQLNGMLYDTYLFGPEKNKRVEQILAKAVVIPEIFFGAPHPSVWIYKDGEAVYEEEEYSGYKQLIADGINDYVKKVYPFVREYHISFRQEEVLSGLFRLLLKPNEEEAVQIGNLENVDGFVKQQDQKKYIARLTMEDIRKNPRIEIYWLKGILKRLDISAGVKVYVTVKTLAKTILKNVRKS